MSEQGMRISEISPEQAKALQEAVWGYIEGANVVNLRRLREDLFSWRRGSAQMVLQVSPKLNSLSIYSVLVTDVPESMELYRYLLNYNTLQRRETLGLVERGQQRYVVLKYTMELELATAEIVQRHVYAIQEVADHLDTELANAFGGNLHFEEWNKMNQEGVDNLLDNLFG